MDEMIEEALLICQMSSTKIPCSCNQQWPDYIIDLSVGKGMAQPCGLVMSTAIPIGEIVPVSWYNDS